MTFTLTEVLVLIMTIAVVALAVSLVRTAGRVADASTEAARMLHDLQALVPRARATLDELEARAEEARAVTQGSQVAMREVTALTANAREISESLSHALVEAPRRYEAIVSGAVTGLRLLKEHFSEDDDGDERRAATTNGRFPRGHQG